jgi:hypothetical protein
LLTFIGDVDGLGWVKEFLEQFGEYLMGANHDIDGLSHFSASPSTSPVRFILILSVSIQPSLNGPEQAHW